MILALRRMLLVGALFLVGACGMGATQGPVPPVQGSTGAGSGMAQVVGILDYVASDYGGAVQHGAVVSQSEFQEQLGLVDDATGIARRQGGARDGTLADLAGLRARMVRHDDPAAIREACRGLRETVVSRYGLVLAPTTTPSRARAETLYAANCSLCHGPEGAALTPRAAALTPHPADFTSVVRMGGVSPYRAFHGITYGVRNTSMASFDALPAADRWSLAFYVVGLRHDGANVGRGRRLFERAGRPVVPTAARLSQMTEDELEASLARALPDKQDQWDVLGYLRLAAPYEVTGGATFARARELLAEAATEARAGHREAASRSVIASYLDGVEPHEASLRTRDRALCSRIEAEYVGLRGDLTRGAPLAMIERREALLNELLARAEDHRGTGRTAAFLGSLAISLREGIEAALLVAALLSFVRRKGHAAQLRWVHAGWIVAIPAGVVTWLLAGAALSGAGREVTEGVVSLLAAGVLLMVSHWMLGRHESQRWLKFLERRVVDAGSRGARWALAGLAFGAVYREAFETVLFYRALMLDAVGHTMAVGVGAVSGVGALAVLVFILQRVGLRLKPRPFMLASSVVLSFMVLVFAGRGIRSLQEAGVVPLSPVRAVELPWLGLYATREGMLLQGLVAGFLVATAVYALTGGDRPGALPTTARR